jgi:hypothetical protein
MGENIKICDMILIPFRTGNGPNGQYSEPERELTPEEQATVIARWGDLTHVIYFQADDVQTQQWANYQAAINAVPSVAEKRAQQIARYREVAMQLIEEINVINAAAGLNAAQAVTVEENFDGVYRAIERGYFPLALLRLESSQDTGITYQGQDLKAVWTSKITQYKNAHLIP